ncbi:MAG TPA: A24 family peptidase [Candidatus Dormibacteraeota bacterium]
MNAALVVVAAVAGAAAGAGAGWVNVALERIERLKEEEDEERTEYEREVQAQRDAAIAAGSAPPQAAPWIGESYGWTWREQVLAPLAAAFGFAVFTAHGPVQWGLLIHLVWLVVFVQIVTFDLKHRLILNRVTYPSIVVALGIAQFSPGLSLLHALFGAAAVAVFFLLQNIVSRGSVGLGDAKLGALIGAVTGLSTDAAHLGAAYAVVYGVLVGGAVAVLLLITRVRHLKDPIPYGPFLCAGAAIILYQGP